MIKSDKIFIHLGLHKTGSTFLQRTFFPYYQKESGFISLRRKRALSDFNQYILRENDLTYSKEKAFELLSKKISIKKLNTEKLTLSEEQFSGSPWNNAKDRKRNFDRLIELFPNANFILVVRNEQDLVQSLYKEYIKKGGTASGKNFLSAKQPDLEFSRGTYLDYYTYYKYILSHLSLSNKLLVLLYEDFKINPIKFLSELSEFIGFEIDPTAKMFQKIDNKSLVGVQVNLLRFVNRFSSSFRQPYLLVPQSFFFVAKKIILKLPAKKKFNISEDLVNEFCKRFKKNNYQLTSIKHSKRDNCNDT